MGWVMYIGAAVSLLAGNVQAAISYVDTLPPQPIQASITCKDAAWEQANLATVSGNQVHVKLAPFVQKLVNTARDERIYLGITAAYRSCDTQIYLRQLNCGMGEFNVYQKPSLECTPPTEPPGKSLHNEGLAIDFNCQGYGMIESSPCLGWLEKNAQHYHLKKHAIEAWHWSTTGL